MTEESADPMGQELEELIKTKIDEFNEKIKTDEKLNKEFEGEYRKAQLTITDGKTYSFELKDKEVQNFQEGGIDKPDIVFTSDKATLLGVLKKEINPLKAVMITKKLKIKASLEDMLRFRKFF
jgi:putative sterol carrier protein